MGSITDNNLLTIICVLVSLSLQSDLRASASHLHSHDGGEYLSVENTEHRTDTIKPTGSSVKAKNRPWSDEPSYKPGDEVFARVDEMPLLLSIYKGPGAPTSEEEQESYDLLKDYVITNFTYPQEAIDSETQGLLVVSFIVDRGGRLHDFKVAKSLGDAMTEEISRVFEVLASDASMAWRPGYYHGNPANVKLTIPLRMRLP